MCQKPSVFSGFHNGPFMGCNNSPWLTTQMMSRRQRLNTEAPACNRSRKNKQKTHKQKKFITWCFTACDGIVLFLWFLGSWLSAVVGSVKSWPTLKGRWCWWWWQVVLLEEEDLPAVPFRPERGPGQVVKPPFNVPQLFMCVCGSRWPATLPGSPAMQLRSWAAVSCGFLRSLRLQSGLLGVVT